MIANILIGTGIFLIGGMCGSFIGAMYVARGITKINKMFKEDTGEDFVAWIFDKSNEIRKNRIDFYAAA